MNKNTQPTQAPQYKNAVRQNTQSQPAKKRRRKIRFKPNKEGMLALIALLVIVALAVTLIVFVAKGIIYLANNTQDETTASSDNNQPPATLPWNNAYISDPRSNTDVAAGELILVNFKNDYELTDTLKSKLTKLSERDSYKKEGYYVLSALDLGIRTDIIEQLDSMLIALVDANPETLGKQKGTDRLLISSGYRDIQKQTELYENRKEENYVALPKQSEHHTGYAVDIQVFKADQSTVHLRPEEQSWMEAHCAEYGFILRYDGSKHELTGILDESWHYRYVGVPHATYMMEHSLCLEEYLEKLRTSHSYDKTPLEFSVGETDYLVYYVPATENATLTEIPVPPASEGTYTISGDNMNGFIVTVTKAS